MYKNIFTQLFNADGGNGGNNGGDGQNQNTNNQNNNNGNQSSTNSSQNDNMIPYARFKEVNDNYKTVKDQLDQLLKDKAQADEDAKKKQGEFESLYNDLKSKHDPLEASFKQYEETFKSILNSRLETVPENYRDLIPNGSDLEKLQWIENAMSKNLFKTNNTQSFGNQGNNPPNNNQNTVTKSQFVKMSYSDRVKLANENPELYKSLAK
ncbi:hypothetical protein [Neobacillus mesonae]|uniref:hypothetical protein n=1 Tax=Neobacillus mesonae TaxID=1193713 RepID=UPI002573D980|nr:hypothetical protein [Neobacillus mesonae]